MTPDTETSEMVSEDRPERMALVLSMAVAMAEQDSGPKGSQLFDIHWKEFGVGYLENAGAAYEIIRLTLDAAEQRASSDVKVKGLEWTEVPDGWFGNAGTETRFVRMGWREDAPYEFAGECFATLAEAQSAAQNHLRHCILSALQIGGGDA